MVAPHLAGASALVFVVPGEPVAKERPRFAKVKKKGSREERVVTYTPKTTAHYEQLVRLHALRGRAIARWPEPRTEDRFSVSIELRLRDPKPRDLDNFAKSILDGLQPVVLRNDAQVCRLELSRILNHPTPGARIEVMRVRERVAPRSQPPPGAGPAAPQIPPSPPPASTDLAGRLGPRSEP